MQRERYERKIVEMEICGEENMKSGRYVKRKICGEEDMSLEEEREITDIAWLLWAAINSLLQCFIRHFVPLKNPLWLPLIDRIRASYCKVQYCTVFHAL